MNVLSLFDGMSCGQQALERAGLPVTNYYASEIDKHAIAVTMHNYPNTIQLGSVVNADGYALPPIDLLIGGSPCQSFSFAGKRKGMATKCETEILTLEHYLQLKKEGFEFEAQSYLFWEYMRLLHEVKPKYFLLENVEMGEKWERVLSKAIGVNGVHINSALVSAQNRKRIYWTNIGHVPGGLFGDLVCTINQPKDKGIMLKDILEKEVDQKYYLSEKAIKSIQSWNAQQNPLEGIETNNRKNGCLTARGNEDLHSGLKLVVHNTMPRSGDPTKGGTGHLSRTDGKTYCLDTGSTNAVEIVGCVKFGRTDEAKEIRKENMKKGNDTTPFQEKKIVGYDYEKMNTLTTASNKDNLVSIMLGRSANWGAPESASGKHYTLCKNEPHGIRTNSVIRRLTPTECERLQTVKDGYTAIASDSQRYKMLGNGWTVEVIAYIFSYINATTLQK
jgi:DNA (cytosine-5)-methyltransferase 3A